MTNKEQHHPVSVEVLCRSKNRRCRKQVRLPLLMRNMIAKAYFSCDENRDVYYWLLFIDKPTIHALVDLEDAACGQMPVFNLNGLRINAVLLMPYDGHLPEGMPDGGCVILSPSPTLGYNYSDLAQILFNHIKKNCSE